MHWNKLTILTLFAVSIGIFCISFFPSKIIRPTPANVLYTENDKTEENSIEFSYLIKNQNIKPKISALSYFVGDLETGQTILMKNENNKLPIASVSKLMTALISLNSENQEGTVKITKQALATSGENGNFHLNEKVKLSEILYPLLLESSNDAAEAIAISAGRDSFIKNMNELAEKIGLSSTTFEDPSGLSPKNVSTTTDLFKLAKYLKDNKPDLFKITTSRSYKDGAHTWFSNNQFLKNVGYEGGKSGYTDEAMQTVLATFSVPFIDSPTRSVAITLLHSKDRRKDVENILKYLKTNVSYGEKTATAVPDLVPAPVLPPVPEAKEPDFVTMTFAGDIMLDRGVKSSVMKNFGGDYSKLFDNLGILNNSDIVFANLEGTASDRGSDLHNLYSFRMDPSVIPALAGAGINILSVANNHVGDWGRDAYTDTLARLRENEILYTGGGSNSDEAEAPAVMEKYGIRLGFLGFSDKGPDWMRATGDSAGILTANNPRFDTIIQNAAKQVDYLIVSFHFGEEYQTTHNARQEDLAHRAVDDGAKIVIGAHPHVIEDTEVYSSKDCTQSSCMGYIAYSLGNFIFDQSFSSDTMQGMILKIKLNKDGNMSVTKNIEKLNNAFQPFSVVPGKEEKIKFEESKPISR